MEGTFAVAPQFQGVLVIHPSPPPTTTSPSNFRNFSTWLGVGLVPSGKHICEKKKSHYIFMQKIIFLR